MTTLWGFCQLLENVDNEDVQHHRLFPPHMLKRRKMYYEGRPDM